MTSNSCLSDIRSLINDRVPTAPKDLFVYVMGAYTTSSPSYHMTESASRVAQWLGHLPFIQNAHPEDPIFEFASGSGQMEDALAGVAEHIRTHPNLGYRAFLATDVGVPTKKQAQENSSLPDDAGIDPLTQSMYYAAVSNAVLFVFSKAGVNDGVANELGAVTVGHQLHDFRDTEFKKDPKRFMYLRHCDVGSATLNELPAAVPLTEGTYSTTEDIHREVDGWLRPIEQRDSQLSDSNEPIHRFGPDEVNTDVDHWRI